jgi:hypothetical protein
MDAHTESVTEKIYTTINQQNEFQLDKWMRSICALSIEVYS